jgi:hypothetical protein
MNRERAETFLRMAAEAELRDPGRPRWPAPPPGESPLATMSFALSRAASTLVAVGALDLETAEAIVADAELARAVRRHEPPEAGVTGPPGQGWAGPPRVSPRRFARARLKAGPGRGAGRTPAPAEPRPGPDRYVPVGRMILFHDETISGELDLMSYAHTASGARLIASWQTRDPLGPRRRGLPPVEDFTVTDDQGQRYELVFATKGRPESSCDLGLRPDPPPGIRWLDITGPGEQAVRVDLDRRVDGPAPEVSDTGRSAGEHLLNRIAERILTLAPEFPAQLATMAPVPLTNLTLGLGTTIAALQAAEMVPPDSPVPGRLAALCASLRVGGHGITAEPAPDLPEPWLSVLSHYHRRKPDIAPARDGFAAMAAALPELDGIRLVLLGLHNCDGSTWVNALALGQLSGPQHGLLGLDMAIPLSIWVRDDAGRWHVARPAGWFDEDGEAALTLRLTPPLTRCPAWIEVLAAGESAEVRATVPLGWGYPL